MSNQSSTYQACLRLYSEQEEFLSGYAEHYNYVERMLYTDMQKTGAKAATFKNEYLIKFGITARQFNAIGRNLEGKIDSVLALLPLHKQELQSKITKAKKVIPKIKKKDKLHQKKRRLNILETRMIAIDHQILVQEPRICFGSRALFQKQYNLEENGYSNHQEWKSDWTAKRNSQFYVLGSKDETAGCQGCVISANLDGTFNLKLRSLSKTAHHILLENISFKYGHDVIREAMRNPQALSFRFLRNDKGWRVMITTNLPDIKIVSTKASGSIGIDINADCLAVSETDRFGNMISSQVVPLVTYGKDQDQAKAIIGDAVKAVVAIAAKALKPIIIEKLDFSKKKAALENEDPKYARMLSSFSCNKVVQGIKSRAYRSGIEVLEVNPAYTSTIGAVNYAARYGISTHQAAAFAIARRGLGFSEEPVKRTVIQVRNGGHVTFPVPVRKPGKHVWTQWAAIRKELSAAHVAHARSGDYQKSPAPLNRICFSGTLCPTWALSVRSRHANRQQHCSADVMEDAIPW
jgi:IS605 OrfB family transposase